VMAEAELALGDLSGAPASLGHIIEAAHRGADLCRLMLACSGRATFVPQPTDLAAAARAAVERLRHDLPASATLTVNAPAEGPRVAGDSGQLAKVLSSLVNNAVEALAGAPGEVSVSVSAAWRGPAELGLDQAGRPLPAGDYALLVVRDSGCGMDSDTLARAFDPFFTTKFTGRGLGLAAVQGIVWAHGGAISVSTQPGAGTTITVALPALAASTVGGTGTGEWQAGGMVLLADDDVRVRRVSARVLTHLGFDVVAADDGHDAMRLFGLHRDQLRLAILDVMMPGTTGVDVLAGMRRVRPGLPALLMSGHSEIDLSGTPPSGAPTAFLAKPFSQERLRQALAQVLSEAD